MLGGIRSVPLWAAYVAIVLTLLALSFFLPRDDIFPPGSDLKDPAQATLTTLSEIMKLVLSLNAAMLAAAGALIVKGTDWFGGWRKFEGLMILCVFLSGVVVYFGVYTCNMAILTMVNAETINPLETSLLWSLKLQYFGLILGGFLLGLAFSLMMDRTRKDDRAEPESD